MAGTDFSHLTDEELLNGIKALNIPDYIRSKAYGVDVRETLAQMTEMLMQLAYNQGMSPQQAKEWVSQLNNKIDKGNLSVNDINKNLGKFDQTFMTDEFLQQMAGTTPINAVPADGSLTTEKFANNSVTDTKLANDAIALKNIKDKTFVKNERTINLFNKNASGIEHGGYLNGNTWVESSSHSVSDYIPIELSTGYTLYGPKNPTPVMARFSFYDKDKKYITGGTSQSDKITSSAYPYVRFHFLTNRLDGLMFIKDSDLPEDKSMEYIPYEVSTYQLQSDWKFGSENILTDAVTATEIDGAESKLVRTINNFNKNDSGIRSGGYYNAGVWTPSSGNTTSGFIKIEPNTSYTFYHKDPPEKVGSRINFYDSNFNYASGGSGFSEKLTGGIHPYVRVTMQSAYMDSFMMIKDSDIPSKLEYVPYETTKNTLGEKWDVLSGNDLKPFEDKLNVASNFQMSTYTPHTKLNLPDFSGYNQSWHPSAEYIESGFAGSKYWLVQSPYPNGGLPSRVRWEVPVVYKSNDGVNWTVVANPLDDLTQVEIDRGDYMSDPEIVWREDLGRLEVWYRHSVGTGTLPTTIFRKTTSDGITWSAREVMMTEKVATDPLFMRSPSLTFEDGKYKAWFTNDSRNLFARPLMYSESTDGKTWSQPTNCTVDIYRTPWHTSVTKIDETYHYLCYYRPINWADFAGIGETLFYYTSTDGINYKFERTILSTTDNNSSTFYKNGLYRSDVIKGHDGKIKLYFCFVDDAGKNSIGYMSADNLKVMNAVPKVDARNAVTRNGESLDDLQMKLDRLRSDLDKLLTK